MEDKVWKLFGVVEAREKILFDGHSVGFTNGEKALEWKNK